MDLFDKIAKGVQDGLKKSADEAYICCSRQAQGKFDSAIVVVDKSFHSLDVAKVALTVAQGILHGAKVVLDGAIAFLEGVKITYKVGVSAITALVDFALTKLINIREIYFKVALGAASRGEF